MAFERDFVQKFHEDGRTALINYHKALKQANLDMVPLINGMLRDEGAKHGDERFAKHYASLAKQEEHSMMSLIGPPDRADHEMMNVPPNIAALVYGAYAAVNAVKTEQLKNGAPAAVVEHFERVTKMLENLAHTAATSETKVPVPVSLLNMNYDAILAEVHPLAFEAAVGNLA